MGKCAMSVREVGPKRWQRLKPLLDRALDLAGAERTRFLAELSDEDADLRSDLERLIASKPPTEGDVDSLAAALAPAALTAALGEHEGGEDPRINQVLGHYRLVRVLGIGGMGTVYVAERHDGDFVQQVALKIVEGAGINSAVRARFERERQILAPLRHPNIASLFDGGVTPDGSPYYTMELVEGENIADYCREHVHTVEERIGLLIQVATALAYAHQHLVVHRDIKPSNILVTADEHVKLLDFGIAKPVDDTAEAAMTQTGIGPMTREYAAPEQFRGGAITVATDVFQFGTLCYRILSGGLPYRADPGDAYAWAQAVTEEEPLPLSRAAATAEAETGWSETTSMPRLRHRLRGDLDAIVRKALAKIPEQRYRSMDAMIADLEAFLAGRPVTARRAGTLYFTWRWIARRPVVSAGALVAVVALVTIAIYATVQARAARTEATRANNEAERATSVNNFLIELFKVSDPGVNRGEKLNANQILERGAERIDKEFANQPEQRARLEMVIAEVYTAMGDIKRARAPVEAAVSTLRSQKSPNAHDLGLALSHLASVMSRLGDNKNVLATYDEAEALLKEKFDPDAQVDLIQLYVRRGVEHHLVGEDELAVRDTQLALDLVERTHMSQFGAATIHSNLGVWQLALGHYRLAKSEYEHALAIYRMEHKEDDIRMWRAALNLGEAETLLGDLDQAKKTLLESTENSKRLLGEKNSDFALNLNYLGNVELQQGHLEEALDHITRSEQIYAAALGDRNPALIEFIINRGRVELAQHNYVAAMADFQRALDLGREKLPPDHPDIARALMFAADALIPMGKSEDALSAAEQALAIRRAKLRPDHPDLAQALLRVGLARQVNGDLSGARTTWQETLDVAAKAYEPGSVALAEIRQRIAHADDSFRPQ